MKEHSRTEERPDGPSDDVEKTSPAADAPSSEGRSWASRSTTMALLRASHPRQAVLIAAGVALTASLMGRATREVVVAGIAVLLVQASLGLSNDICDRRIDHAAARGARSGKPIADGTVGRADALWLMLVLLFVAVPVSVQSGTVAGIALLVTVPIGWIHNRWLHRGALSFVGWVLTFGLLPAFCSYGGWGAGEHGGPPTIAVTAVAALLGLCLHFLTSLPDLVTDNRGGVRSLPLRVALRVGAPRLLAVSGLATVVVAIGLVLVAVAVGVRQ